MNEPQDWSQLRDSIIGLGTDSSRRTYYPELLARVAQLEETRESLRRSEENLLTLFNGLNDAIFIHDWEGHVLEANDAMLAMYEVTRETFRDHTIQDYSEGPLTLAHIETMRHQLDRDGSLVFEWQARRPTRPEAPLDVEVAVRRVCWYGQNALVSVVRDISGRKRLEAMLNQSQRLDSLGQLAGGVAHDTNNMLGVIIGYTDLLLERTEAMPNLRRDLEQIRKAALHSADLNRQLLAFARQQAIQPTLLNLNDKVEDTQKMLRRLISEQHTLARQPALGLWNVWMDPSQVEQILTNLVVNARDALGTSGTITVETANATLGADANRLPDAEPGDYVVLRVRDTGRGIPAEILPHIFEPFFTTKAPGQGTGLGLATVYGIVRQNGGFIQVATNPGQGTTFAIHLPRLPGGNPAASAGPAPGAAGGHESVLLVEDEEILLETAARILEDAGYQVTSTPSPLEALRWVEEGLAPTLLATDVVMPGLDGPGLWEGIRTLRPGMKVLFLSGYPASNLGLAAPRLDGLGFLQKPFTRNELLQAVRDALEV